MKPYDAIVMGGGHNGLVAACYLSKAGLSVLVLEKQDHLGGASISAQVFPGVDAWPSRYAYLVSLFPQKIIDDLGLSFTTVRRKIASYTPSGTKEILMCNEDPALTERSLLEAVGQQDYAGYKKLLALESVFAKKVWPTMLEKMLSCAEMKKMFTTPEEREAWELLVEKPLGEGIEKYITDDALRGLIFTDAKIGALVQPGDTSLLQNRVFLLHIIGGGNGEWRIPVGGMGALVKELERVARAQGVTICTASEVTRVLRSADCVSVTLSSGETFSTHFFLSGAAPAILAKTLGEPYTRRATGSVFKINMLLTRLPKLRTSKYSAEQAFGGTFHVHEGYSDMKAGNGFAGEMYCHTLTDRTILSKELADKGYQTLTFFGLDMPYARFAKNNEEMKKEVLAGYLKSINDYLAEPIEDCFAKDANGNQCIEAKSPIDIENELGMPEGNIFHDEVSWPFSDAAAGTWGVETGHPNISICGAGALRGGGVSGIPGHNAAMAVLERMR